MRHTEIVLECQVYESNFTSNKHNVFPTDVSDSAYMQANILSSSPNMYNDNELFFAKKYPRKSSEYLYLIHRCRVPKTTRLLFSGSEISSNCLIEESLLKVFRNKHKNCMLMTLPDVFWSMLLVLGEGFQHYCYLLWYFFLFCCPNPLVLRDHSSGYFEVFRLFFS